MASVRVRSLVRPMRLVTKGSGRTTLETTSTGEMGGLQHLDPLIQLQRLYRGKATAGAAEIPAAALIGGKRVEKEEQRSRLRH